MKRSIVLGLMAVMAISGCQVKEIDEFASDGKPFTATMEAIVDDVADVDTKTSLDASGNVRWKRGDQVSIFAGSTVNEHYQVTDASDGKTAAALSQIEITGFVAGGEISNNVAFYPYAATAEIAKGDGNSYVISDIALPAIQTYAKSSFGNGAFPMVAVTSSPRDYNLKFKNVLGGLKLQLKGTAAITSISIKGNNNDILCGEAELTVSVAAAPAITLTDALAKTVTLDCGGGVQLNAKTATAFIIALPPMIFSGGFTVTVTDTENKRMEIKTTRRQTITRSSLLSMPAVTYEGTSVPDPFDVGSDLSVNGTANCYVVTKAGDFSFDASVMGNGPDGYLWEATEGADLHLWPYHQEEVYFSSYDVLPNKAFVIWDDNEVMTNVVYNAGTKRISFTATGNKGSALIGLFDKYATESDAQASIDEACWSWHIWCTDAPQVFIMYDDNGNEYEILDRNLGATSADPADGVATYGYFYQFGRKDPLKGYDGIAASQKYAELELKHSVNHPTYYYKYNVKTTEWYNNSSSSLSTVCADLWGNPAWKYASTANIHPYQAERSELKKTIYDPCPPGYMVPPETCWTGINAASITLLDNGVIIPTASGDSFYPFAGYINDLKSWENDSMGYYAYNGCTITQREKRAVRVYNSYTSLHSEWDYDNAYNHYGGCSLSVHINDGDEIIQDNLQFEPMYQSQRQRGHNVRCVKEFNN